MSAPGAGGYLLREVCLLPGGTYSRGCLLPGGCLLWGVLPPGGCLKNVICKQGLTQETRMLPLSQEDTGKKTQEF